MHSGAKIYIYNKAPSARLHYIAGFLSDSLGMHFEVTDHQVENSPLILYGDGPELIGFRIPDSGFLSETGIRKFEPPISRDGITCLFPSQGQHELHFDIFSAIFYLITRYEEYLPFEPDQYGRFEVEQSFTFKNGFHHLPLVDQWLCMFSDKLNQRFTDLKFPAKKFRFISTFDIDSPWAFKHRRIWRNAAALVNNLAQGHTGDFIQKLQVLIHRIDDPFNVYAFIRETEAMHQFSSIFFFLLADRGRIDPNHSLHSPAYRSLLRDLSADHTTGIHPSFHSNSNDEGLAEEISLYRSFTGKAAENSRQHYLILKFPETYRRLAHHGILNDYSMGYASGMGFRAGTTLPFKFYDVLSEQQTELTIHPFAVMDVTLRQYLQMDTEQASEAISGLIHTIRSVNGIFTSLWHNESLSESGWWKGWRQVFLTMISAATEDKNY